MATTPYSFRLSEPAERKLLELADLYGSQVRVVEVAIDRLYHSEVEQEASEMNANAVMALVKTAAVDDPTPIGETSVVWRNEDGTYSVSDNGEEVAGLTAQEAVRIVMENEGLINREDEMEKIKIYRSQLEVWTLEELGLDEWPRLSASDMPAALVILEDDKPPEACTVWGLPHKMSVEDAWEEFEHSDEYIVVD